MAASDWPVAFLLGRNRPPSIEPPTQHHEGQGRRQGCRPLTRLHRPAEVALDLCRAQRPQVTTDTCSRSLQFSIPFAHIVLIGARMLSPRSTIHHRLWRVTCRHKAQRRLSRAMLSQRRGLSRELSIQTERGLLVDLPPSDTVTKRQRGRRIAWKRVGLLAIAMVLGTTLCSLLVSSWRASLLFGFRAAQSATRPLSAHAMTCLQETRARRRLLELPCDSPAPGCLVHVLVGADDTALWNATVASSSGSMAMYNETSHWCTSPVQRSRPTYVKLAYDNEQGQARTRTVYGSEAACMLHHLDLLRGIWICTL